MIARIPHVWRDRRPPQDQDGFTLAEILVALTILAIMGGMTTTFLGQLRKVSAMQAEQTVQQELDAAARYLERSLESALALPVDMTQAGNRSFLTGTSSEVSYVSAARMGVSPASLRTKSVRLETEPGAARNRIAVTIEPRRFAGKAAAPITVTLLSGIDTISFEYLDAVPGSTTRQWLNRWKRERQLPIAIRFTITREADGRTYEAGGLARLTMARQPT